MSQNYIDIDVRIQATDQALFEAFASEQGLNAWWSETCKISPDRSSIQLTFGPNYTFIGTIEADLPHAQFTIVWGASMDEWEGTRLTFQIKPVDDQYILRLTHSGWRHNGHEMRKSAYFWAHLLRGLKAYVESGIVTPFSERSAD